MKSRKLTEDEVIKYLCKWLEKEKWKIIDTASAKDFEKGIDIIA